jgi:hypothetical protein
MKLLLRSLLQSPVTSSILSPDIFLNIIFIKKLQLSSFNAMQFDSHINNIQTYLSSPVLNLSVNGLFIIIIIIIIIINV